MHNWPGMPVGSSRVRAGPADGAPTTSSRSSSPAGARTPRCRTPAIDPMLFVARAIMHGAADDRLPQHPSARRRRGQRHAGARRRHLERDPARKSCCAAPCARSRRAVQDLIERRDAQRSSPASRATFDMTADAALRAPLSGDGQRRERETEHAPPRRGARGRRRQRRPRSDAEHGLRGFRVHAAGEARLLRLARHGAGADGRMLHNPHYDFNDDVLPIGASYWVPLAETMLGDGDGQACVRGYDHRAAPHRPRVRPSARGSRADCSPSPIRLKAITARKMRGTGIKCQRGAGGERARGTPEEHIAPARRGRLDAEAQEAQDASRRG